METHDQRHVAGTHHLEPWQLRLGGKDPVPGEEPPEEAPPEPPGDDIPADEVPDEIDKDGFPDEIGPMVPPEIIPEQLPGHKRRPGKSNRLVF